jgi:hypothetical protein
MVENSSNNIKLFG